MNGWCGCSLTGTAAQLVGRVGEPGRHMRPRRPAALQAPPRGGSTCSTGRGESDVLMLPAPRLAGATPPAPRPYGLTAMVKLWLLVEAPRVTETVTDRFPR